MDDYEANLLRLNKKICELITQNDALETQNRLLVRENQTLQGKVSEMHGKCEAAEVANAQCFRNLEQAYSSRQELSIVNERQKEKYNMLVQHYVSQSAKFKVLQLKSAKGQPGQPRGPVEIIGKASDIGKPPVATQEPRLAELEAQCDKLQKKLNKAYDAIDELEFELESIDYLQSENEQLRQQIGNLQRKTAPCQERTSNDTAVASSFEPLPATADGAKEPPPVASSKDTQRPTDGGTTNHGTLRTFLALDSVEEGRAVALPTAKPPMEGEEMHNKRSLSAT